MHEIRTIATDVSVARCVCTSVTRLRPAKKWLNGSRSCLGRYLGTKERCIRRGSRSSPCGEGEGKRGNISPTQLYNTASTKRIVILSRLETLGDPIGAHCIRRGSRSPTARGRGIQCGLRQITLTTCHNMGPYSVESNRHSDNYERLHAVNWCVCVCYRYQRRMTWTSAGYFASCWCRRDSSRSPWRTTTTMMMTPAAGSPRRSAAEHRPPSPCFVDDVSAATDCRGCEPSVRAVTSPKRPRLSSHWIH